MPKNNWKRGRGLFYFLVLSGRPLQYTELNRYVAYSLGRQCIVEWVSLSHETSLKIFYKWKITKLKKVEESSKKGVGGDEKQALSLYSA